MKKISGHCLCGTVSLNFSPKTETFAACHCGMCRKWAGNSMLSVEVNKDISFSGEDSITVYNSSEWADRGFCEKCGTHLFYRTKSGEFTCVPLGLLEDVDHLKFAMQIFIDRKPANFSFAEKTNVMTEKEVFAKFSP